MNILPSSFYERETTIVAKELLGKRLIRKNGKTTISGIIIETEAYRSDDPASHTYIGKTERNKAMFGEVGRAYVYSVYGIHYCINVVARNKKFEAGGVLIRSIKPEKGINIMMKNRKTNILKNLTNGPAKLTQALQIDKKQYGVDLTKHKGLFITEGISSREKILSSTRIGIKKGLGKKWNFKIDV